MALNMEGGGLRSAPFPGNRRTEQPVSAEELLGKQLVQIEELGTRLDATIMTIHMLKNGTVTLDQVELHDGGFTVNDLEQEETPVA